MEDQKKNDNNVISNMWANWCDLPIETRQVVAEKLGVVGNLLSIAANMQSFAKKVQNDVATEQQVNQNNEVEDDENIIEAEFVEVD